MQPWKRYLLAIIFYNNSMDAAGTAKIAALYRLANRDVLLTISLRRVDPWWGSSLATTIGPEAGWVAPSEVHSPRWHCNGTSVLDVNLIVNLQIRHDNKSSTWMVPIKTIRMMLNPMLVTLTLSSLKSNMLISNTLCSYSITAMQCYTGAAIVVVKCFSACIRPEPYSYILWLVGSFSSSSCNKGTFHTQWAIHIKLYISKNYVFIYLFIYIYKIKVNVSFCVIKDIIKVWNHFISYLEVAAVAAEVVSVL